MTNKVKTAITIGAMFVPFIAFAQTNFSTVCDVANLVNRGVNVFAWLIYVLAFLSILYSAFLFLTSGGSEDKVKSARQALLWGLIGIAVALFASYARTFVANAIVGGSFNQSCAF
ncbi:MAG: hypothetical protein A2633_03095 [Candidatus Sungbacteria bacterium RIFCSPHIGHO2_01_FULL_47_32]|uniref:TrbC/VirB2 family protein n=1 Tax=Candidatus Sungbacteria bacterium RIFCSPHIGHO2_01_FULL_47_32 TaxID=1802264 RepID=A0A1G2K3F7_9BACT|nr:MAG: hypothetical protein A2633_03095 [Candidatus Sungbacteria bacterium RIFCSPHIGHO2_01_FULL_47_32]